MGTGGAGGDFSLPQATSRWDQHPPDPKWAWKTWFKALGIPEGNILAVKNQEAGKGGCPESEIIPRDTERKRRDLGMEAWVAGEGAEKLLGTGNWLQGRKNGVKSRNSKGFKETGMKEGRG